MAAFMWLVWVVGTLLSLGTIYVLLRVLYSGENFNDTDRQATIPHDDKLDENPLDVEE